MADRSDPLSRRQGGPSAKKEEKKTTEEDSAEREGLMTTLKRLASDPPPKDEVDQHIREGKERLVSFRESQRKEKEERASRGAVAHDAEVAASYEMSEALRMGKTGFLIADAPLLVPPKRSREDASASSTEDPSGRDVHPSAMRFKLTQQEEAEMESRPVDAASLAIAILEQRKEIAVKEGDAESADKVAKGVEVLRDMGPTEIENLNRSVNDAAQRQEEEARRAEGPAALFPPEILTSSTTMARAPGAESSQGWTELDANELYEGMSRGI